LRMSFFGVLPLRDELKSPFSLCSPMRPVADERRERDRTNGLQEKVE